MKENSIEKDEEILNNIKSYMQENIDKGYHKFVYNDLGYDVKCADVINAIDHILSDYKKLKEEFKAVDRECSRLECKEVELEKTIDLMAEFFNKRSWREHQLKDDNCYCCKTEYGADDCKDCLKEHFINKAKEVKK